VDHASGLDYVHPQESTSAIDTIVAKEAFEIFASRHNVKIKHYHCDNGIFASKKFGAAVEDANRTMMFCAVNAHHQNGVAERRIQDLTDWARAMLVNACHKNPFATDNMWPFALRQASAIDRTIPKRAHTKLPLEIFTDVDMRPKTNHFHPFGCPVYVLNAPLQEGKSQPKWEERARVGCYLGLSSQHATSVSLILHPQHFVSPQFHCVSDDNFESLSDMGRFATLWPPNAKVKATLGTVIDDYSATTLPGGIAPPWFLSDDDESTTDSDDSSVDEGDPNNNDDDNDFLTDHVYDEPPPEPPEENEGGVPPPPQENEGTPRDEGATLETNEGVRTDTNEGVRTGSTQSHQDKGAPSTFKSRSGRTVKVSDKVLDSAESFASTNPEYSTKLAMTHFYTYMVSMLDDFTFNSFHPLAYVASLADKDTMNFTDAMKQSDRDCFVEAMEKEVVDHVSRNHWKIYSRHQMRQTGYSGKVIMAVWSFKRKRNPFGVITKYKARLCAHGGQTVQGVHYDASYSPVVSWTTIRHLLTLTLVMGWFPRQIDFVLAFLQADTGTNVFMEVPGHFEVQNGKLARNSQAPNPRHQPNVLKLLKNLYGLKDAGLTWFEHLKDGLVKRGFRQSLVEPCMFIRGNLILLVYVDDCIAICPDDEPITKFITSMQTDYVLTDEGNLSAYLGIQVDRKKTSNGLEFTQPALIDRIIETIPLKDQLLH
jgi:hypothetical protein